MQNWFNLSDRQMEDALYEIESICRFGGFSGVTDALPDETTILNFRHLLEKHNLTLVLLDEVNAHLKNQGLLVQRHHGGRHHNPCQRMAARRFVLKKWQQCT
jgi:IS5 family transposase